MEKAERYRGFSLGEDGVWDFDTWGQDQQSRIVLSVNRRLQPALLYVGTVVKWIPPYEVRFCFLTDAKMNANCAQQMGLGAAVLRPVKDSLDMKTHLLCTICIHFCIS